MARKGIVERNKMRIRLQKKYEEKRNQFRQIIRDKSVSDKDRLQAVLSLAALPRNSAKNRIRNRCSLTGHPRGYYRDFGISRMMLRKLASEGYLPGVTKASW